MRLVIVLLMIASACFGQSLRGSKGSQRLQNKEADKENLSRIPDDEALKRMEAAGLLVKVPSGPGIKDKVSKRLRYCRPWTARFITDTGKKYLVAFDDSFRLTSAVRPITDQKALQAKNPNAAAISGPYMTSHPTGSTIDISKKGMSEKELAWFRDYLKKLEAKKMIEATEEHSKKAPCFHIMVFEKYAPLPTIPTPKKPVSRKKK